MFLKYTERWDLEILFVMNRDAITDTVVYFKYYENKRAPPLRVLTDIHTFEVHDK